MQLTQDQRDQLWSKEGPKFAATLTFDTHILNDKVSKILVIVDILINPLTFEIISKNRKHFANDTVILQIIDEADDQCTGISFTWCPYRMEFKSEDDLNDGHKTLVICQEALIRMHKFVMELLAPIK